MVCHTWHQDDPTFICQNVLLNLYPSLQIKIPVILRTSVWLSGLNWAPCKFKTWIWCRSRLLQGLRLFSQSFQILLFEQSKKRQKAFFSNLDFFISLGRQLDGTAPRFRLSWWVSEIVKVFEDVGLGGSGRKVSLESQIFDGNHLLFVSVDIDYNNYLPCDGQEKKCACCKFSNIPCQIVQYG